MAILSREEATTILKKVIGLSKAEGCLATLQGSEEGNVRYALNSVTTSGKVSNLSLAVQSNFGRRSAVATINELDDASLARVVRSSEELARLAPENPEFVPVLGPQKYPEPKAYFESTAKITPEYRAAAAAHGIEPSRAKKLVSAGFLEDTADFQAVATSKGLIGYHRSTQVDFSATVRTEDGTGSGYVVRDVNDVSKLDTRAASQVAIDKALASREPRAIEPGRYTVILEPLAAFGLLQYILFSLDARQADEGRSFLAKAGGGTRKGEKLVDERVTIYSDPSHPEMPSSPFDQEGLARKRTAWIDKGVVKNLYYSRYWAEQKEVEPLPFPGTAAMEGGAASLDDLVADTQKGILVTRTWYIRQVDPQTLLLTGLTRDGTFFVEKGKVAFPIKNLRFNESPIIMLNNLEALGRPQRVQGSLVPPMKLRDFNFTSLSDAV